MTFNKRSKNSRLRGSFTHGYGSKKKHRGAGSRGGRGNAGSGKRADTQKPTMVKEKRVFGRHGFNNPTATGRVPTINIGTIEAITLNGKKGVEFAKDFIKVDLNEMGYLKLLGSGKVIGKYEITVNTASQKAIDKIESVGGKVIVSVKSTEKTPQKAEKKAKAVEDSTEAAEDIEE